MSLSPFSQRAHWLRRLEVDGRNDDPKQRGVEGTHRESTETKLDAGEIDQESLGRDYFLPPLISLLNKVHIFYISYNRNNQCFIDLTVKVLSNQCFLYGGVRRIMSKINSIKNSPIRHFNFLISNFLSFVLFILQSFIHTSLSKCQFSYFYL